MINVTKTFLPLQSEYGAILKRAWDAGWVTNRGVLVKELEANLKNYLVTENIILTTNGTLPLQIAIKALKLKGEIITTPFSYVATTSSIVWEGCTPVFVDIHPEYLTIDESRIEAAITENTSAILATHVYGNPCAVEEIDRIAKKHDLKVIYDGAHCFGVSYNGNSIFNYGDASTCSFHATKLFHTGEGGAIFCHDENYKSLYFHHNFGHDGPDKFRGLGINAKMSELQAAMGLAILPYIDEIIVNRKKSVENYREELNTFQQLKVRDKTIWNYAYFPVVFRTENDLLRVQKAMNKVDIFPRRYFYPSLNKLEYSGDQECPVSESISNRVLCLPLSHNLLEEEQDKVISVLKNCFK